MAVFGHSLLWLSSLHIVLALHVRTVSKSAERPKTAVVLVGLVDKWNDDDGEWIKSFMEKVVLPNDADVFIHTIVENEENQAAILLSNFSDNIFQGHLKSWKDGFKEEPFSQFHGLLQFWHLEGAWHLLAEYEKEKHVKYDVVIKARTQVAPDRKTSAHLDVSKWHEDQGKIHMMTDFMFWGQRDDFEKIVGFYSALGPYFLQEYPDPLSRPIHVKELLASYEADPRYSSGDLDADWLTYNKVDALPIPCPLGPQAGAIENLRAAKEAGIDVCINGQNNCTACWGPKTGNIDKKVGQVACEKDFLDFILAQGLSICDIGASMHTVYAMPNTHRAETATVQRALARDC